VLSGGLAGEVPGVGIFSDEVFMVVSFSFEPVSRLDFCSMRGVYLFRSSMQACPLFRQKTREPRIEYKQIEGP
jgi:hypothetical protein